MDGFVRAHRQQGDEGVQAMGYYDDRDLPYYWNIADRYVLFDRFFSSSNSGSLENHMFWVTATSGNFEGEGIPLEGFGNLPTIFDRLEEAGVSWKFVQNYDPSITFRTARRPENSDRGVQTIWNPLLAYPRYVDDPKMRSRVVDLSEYYNDLVRAGRSYIVPSGSASILQAASTPASASSAT